MSDCEQSAMEILEDWIAGRGKQPVTWNTLIEVLYDIELSTLAREIETVKHPEDRPTEVTECSNQETGNVCAEYLDKRGDEIPTGNIEKFSRNNSEEAVSVIISVNTNPELGFNCGDTNDSEVLGQELQGQANHASGEISGTIDQANEACSEIGWTKDRPSNACSEVGRTKDRASDASGEIGRTKDQTIDASGEIGRTRDQTIDACSEIGRSE